MTAKEYFDKHYKGWKDIEEEFLLTPDSAIHFAENYRKHCNEAENLPISGVTQWVAVEDSLPEPDDYVLIYYQIDDEPITEVACLNEDGTWFKNWKEYPPTHWAKFTKPPCG